MDAGVIVAIVLASVAIVLVVGFLIYYNMRKKGIEVGDKYKYNEAYGKAYSTMYQVSN
jgi:uncharacterized membrane protein